MLKGKEGRYMSQYTTHWASKAELLKAMRDYKEKLEGEVDFYLNFKSDGNEEILEKIVEDYQNQVKELNKEYANARRL